MRKTIIELNEMSDSKEVYGSRPNPFFAGFIYTLVALLAAVLIYSFFGKIEVVATAPGVVRPNDDVSTISSLVSGRVISVQYSDGQPVAAGDTLFSIDTSGAQIELNSLINSRDDIQFKLDMLNKFVAGIESGENPFSAESDGEEYPYYVQYQDFELALQSMRESSEKEQEQLATDAERNKVSLQTVKKQISDLQYQINGLTRYKSSIESGENLTEGYPEYANMYQLYCQTLNGLKENYLNQQKSITIDATEDSNNYLFELYSEQLTNYSYLVESIKSGKSEFPEGNVSECKLLYTDYVNKLEDYERSYESAKETYNYLKENSNQAIDTSTLLQYDETILSGYYCFLSSVKEGQNKFPDNGAIAAYRSLYTDYLAKYDLLNTAVHDAEAAYAELKALADNASEPDSGASEEVEENELAIPTEDELNAAFAEIQKAETTRNNFHADTIISIENKILQLESSLAEKELSISAASREENIEPARIQMVSAEAAIDTYKNSKLLEYRQIKADLEDKLVRLQYTISGSICKEDKLAALEESYLNSVEQKRFETLNQIESSIHTLEGELSSAQLNQRLYQIAEQVYAQNLEKDNITLPLSRSTLEKVSVLLNSIDSMNAQLMELDTQIQKVSEEISHGTIKAERSGVISSVAALVNGDIISAGTHVASIIPVDESAYKVFIYVKSSDIGGIKQGNRIRYNLDALPSNQYGTPEGRVLKISRDALSQEGQYSGYFLIEGSIENAKLVDKDGNEASITIGMQTEAKIVTQEKTIIRYLLEKINLF